MLCKILWQGNSLPLTILEKDNSLIQVQVTPVVFSYWFGVTVGVLNVQDGQFGLWYSSNITDIMTAWRVAQLIPKAKRLREAHGNDQTLCSLVIQLEGDNNEQRRQHLAEDFGVEVEELQKLLTTARQSGPNQYDLEVMLELIGANLNASAEPLISHLGCLERALETGSIELSERSSVLVQAARDARARREEQLQADELEIDQPVDPEHSLARFLADFGVPNLLDVRPDDFGPSHIHFDQLDRLVKEASIGRHAYWKSIELVVSEKNPDDPSAHYAQVTTDGSLAVFSSNFGNCCHPFLAVGDIRLVLHRARYERGGKFLVSVSLRPVPTTLENDDEQDAKEMTLEELRALVGKCFDLAGPLPVFFSRTNEASNSLEPKKRRSLLRRKS